MNRLSLNPRLFGAVAHFRADGDIRYYLACLHVAPHPHMRGALICGTDGHQLALAYDETGEVDKPGLLKINPRTVSAALGRRADRVVLRDGRLCVDVAQRRSKIVEEAHVQAGQAVAPEDWLPRFPVYESILPDGPDDLKPYSMAPVSPRLLEKLAQTAYRVAEDGSRKYGGPIFNYSRRTGSDPINSYRDPIFTRFSVNPNVLVITMPMRGDEMAFPLFAYGLARDGKRRAAARDKARATMPELERRAANCVNRDAEPVEWGAT